MLKSSVRSNQVRRRLLVLTLYWRTSIMFCLTTRGLPSTIASKNEEDNQDNQSSRGDTHTNHYAVLQIKKGYLKFDRNVKYFDIWCLYDKMDTHLILDLVCKDPFSSWTSPLFFDIVVDDDWKYMGIIVASVVFGGLLTGISFGLLTYS